MLPFSSTPDLPPPALHAPAKPAVTRDVLWGRPIFKAPALPSPAPAPVPLPFRAQRVTRRPAVS